MNNPKQFIQGDNKGRINIPEGIKQRIYPQPKQIQGYGNPYLKETKMSMLLKTEKALKRVVSCLSQ